MDFTHNQEFDVLIVGGGVIGLSIARQLIKNDDLRVAVLEKNLQCGAEASFAAAGMLAPQAEADEADDFFRLCSQSRDLYPEFAGELFEQTNLNIELDQTGTLYLAFDENELAELENRFAWQRAADLPIEKLTRREILTLEPNVSPAVLSGLRFPFDWQVENRRLIAALKECCQKYCVPNAAAEKLLFENNKISGIQTSRGAIFAPVVVAASGAWTSLIKDNQSLLKNVAMKPIRGQINQFFSAEKQFSHVIYSPRGYVVPRSDNRLLVGASVEDVGFDNRVTEAATQNNRQIAQEISGKFGGEIKETAAWAGLRPKTPDGLPLLGEFPANSGLYFATGHYRNGILLAPLTAKLIADKIANGVDSPFLHIFNPDRLFI